MVYVDNPDDDYATRLAGYIPKPYPRQILDDAPLIRRPQRIQVQFDAYLASGKPHNHPETPAEFQHYMGRAWDALHNLINVVDSVTYNGTPCPAVSRLLRKLYPDDEVEEMLRLMIVSLSHAYSQESFADTGVG